MQKPYRSGRASISRFLTDLCLVAGFCALSIARSTAQEITVVLLDSRDGQPIDNQTVRLGFRFGTPAGIEATTDTQGVAVVHLPDPMTSSTVVPYIVGPKPLWACWDSAPHAFDVQSIMREGLVMRCSDPSHCQCTVKEKVVGNIKARPGQVTMFAKPLTLWERFISHFYR